MRWIKREKERRAEINKAKKKQKRERGGEKVERREIRTGRHTGERKRAGARNERREREKTNSRVVTRTSSYMYVYMCGTRFDLDARTRARGASLGPKNDK